MHEEIAIGPWIAEPQRNLLRRDDEVRRVGPRVMDLLVCLAGARGDVVSKDRLIAEVWSGRFTSDEALTTAIYELRRALDDDAKAGHFVETVRGRGYRLAVAASPGGPSPDEPSPEERPAATRPPAVGVLLGVAVLAVIATVGVTAWLRPSVETPPAPPPAPVETPREIRSLAVLPLDGWVDECRQDYFAGALTDMLIADLVDLGQLDVLPRWQSQNLSAGESSGLERPPADAIVEGSVVHGGDRIWLSVQLVDVRTGKMLWGGSYEREVGDALDLQRALSLEIAQQIDRVIRARSQLPDGGDADASLTFP